MHRSPTRWTCLAMVCAFVSTIAIAERTRAQEEPPAIAAQANDAQADAAQIAAWIEQLGDDDYDLRETAMRELTKAGASAIEAVAAAVESDSPEIAWRAGELLQHIGVSGDEQTVERVCLAMQKLGAKSQRFHRIAAEMQTRWREFRHARAAATIARLGGEVQDVPVFDGYAFGYGIAPSFGPIYATPTMEVFDSAIVEVESVDIDLRSIILDEPAVRALKVETPEPAAEAESPKLEEAEVDEPTVDEPKPDEAAPTDVDATTEPSPPAPVEDEPSAAPESEEPPVLEPVAEDVAGTTEIAETDLGAALAASFDSSDIVLTTGDISMFYGGGYPLTGIEGTVQAPVQRMVRIGAGWKGGDPDLRALRELNRVNQIEISDQSLSLAALQQIAAVPGLRQLTLQNTKFDRAAIKRFKRVRPNVTVHAFGRAILGVSGEPAGEGFQISNVVPASGAAKAGLAVGDVIRRIEGEAVTDFETLTLVIGGRAPGDEVAVQYDRGGKSHSVKATLGSREDPTPPGFPGLPVLPEPAP